MTTPRKPPTSEGAVQVLALGISLREVAKAIGIAHQTVATWITTDARPGPEARRKLAATYGIPVASWDVPPGGRVPAPKPPTSPTDPPREVGSSLEEARAHLLRCQRQRLDAEQGDDPKLVVQWAELERKALDSVAKLRGDLSPADETRLTQTPRWAAVRGCVVEALRPYPDAQKAVVRALRELDAMGRDEG